MSSGFNPPDVEPQFFPQIPTSGFNPPDVNPQFFSLFREPTVSLPSGSLNLPSSSGQAPFNNACSNLPRSGEQDPMLISFVRLRNFFLYHRTQPTGQSESYGELLDLSPLYIRPYSCLLMGEFGDLMPLLRIITFQTSHPYSPYLTVGEYVDSNPSLSHEELFSSPVYVCFGAPPPDP